MSTHVLHREQLAITSYNYHKLVNTWHLPLRNVLLQSCLRISLLSISHFNRFIIRLQLELVRYNRYHLFYVLTSLQGCHSVMAMGVLLPTRAVHGRPITKDCAIWPITAVRANGKEGFRDSDSLNCFARVVYESFRNEVKKSIFFRKLKCFLTLHACKPVLGDS